MLIIIIWRRCTVTINYQIEMQVKNKVLCIVLLFLSYSSYAQDDRSEWVQELVKIADPVLTALANDELKIKMPKEQGSFDYGDRSEFAHLEAFGRLMAGMAPWLELGPDQSEEGQLRAHYIELAHKATANAVNPLSNDFMNFNKGAQPLVDAAFLAQAFLRAPEQLWQPLSESVKEQVIDAFLATRSIQPYYNNWLLFSATIEAFFLKFTDKADRMRIDYALKKHNEWYLGDGHYGDGPKFRWDYYNSFVIHPMLLDISNVLVEHDDKRYRELFNTLLHRAQRYSVVQEQLISPEATYPIIGRSAIYRLGAFQTLSQITLFEELPETLSYGQVRSALTAVLKRMFAMNGTYDNNNWLRLGVIGHQPQMAEPYITTGSLYLTSVGFLHLGLPAAHEFWTCQGEPWTMLKMWSGNTQMKRDKAKD